MENLFFEFINGSGKHIEIMIVFLTILMLVTNSQFLDITYSSFWAWMFIVHARFAFVFDLTNCRTTLTYSIIIVGL